MSYLKNVKNINCFGGYRMWWRQLWLRFCYVVTLGKYPRLYSVKFITIWNDFPFPEYGYAIWFRRIPENAPEIERAENEGMPCLK